MTENLHEKLEYHDRVLANEASALGNYCIAYSRLEYSINLLIEEILQCDDETRRILVEASGARLASRIEMIRRFSIKRVADDQIRDILNKILAYTQCILQPARNRLIHDFWPLNQHPETGDTKGQVDDRIFRKKRQAHQPEFLTAGLHIERDAKSIMNEYAKVNAARRALWGCAVALAEIRETGTHRQSRLLDLLDADPNNLFPHLNEEPTPPPQSSPE